MDINSQERIRRRCYEQSIMEDLLYMLKAHDIVSTIKDWAEHDAEVGQVDMEDLALRAAARIRA